MVCAVQGRARFTERRRIGDTVAVNQPSFSFRQGKLTTHKEELCPKNPYYLQDLQSAEVRASALNF